jgi:PKD repeat protein
VVVTSSNGCKDTTNFSIQLVDVPVAAFDAIDLCDQESAKLNEQHTWAGTSTSSPVFTWVYNGTNISLDANPTYNFGGPGIYPVTLTVTNPLFAACSSSVTKQIRILPLPIPDFTFESECVKDVKFNGTAIPDSLIAHYSWDFANNGSDTGTSVSHVFLQSGLFNVVFTVTTIQGCVVSVTKPVQIDNKSSEIPEIPNIVTANGDNTNDMIDLNTMLGDCGDYEFALFSRWGNVVYSQKNGGTPFVGKNTQGTWLTPGVYFYVLKFNKEHKSGSITVIR